MEKMKGVYRSMKEKIRATKRRRLVMYGIGAVILVLIIASIAHKKQETTGEVIDVAVRDIERSVKATGEVTSTVDLSLSFESSGTVKTIDAKVGDTVAKGARLMSLDGAQEAAALTRANGALLKAQAEYDQATEVTGGEEIDNLELELENAKREQDLLVANAYRTLLSGDLEAIPDDSSDDTEPPTVSGSYTCDEEGSYKIELYSSAAASGASYTVSGLEDGYSGTVYTTTSSPVGSCGLYLTFPEGFSKSVDWVIEVPNTRGASYVANKNAYDLALDTRDKTISELEAALSLKESQVETGEVKIAYANLVSAQGSYQEALANYEDTVIRAPAPGKVTKIDANLGERVEAFAPVVGLEDNANLYVKAAVNESNIIGMEVGQPVTITFDALDDDTSFTGSITTIDLSPTETGDVVNYIVTVSIDTPTPELRAGMTANIDATIFHTTALAIPRRALVQNDDGTYSVIRMIDEKKTETVPVTLGRDADGGYVEIVNGLNEGEKLAVPELPTS